jgi:hypothetical protein
MFQQAIATRLDSGIRGADHIAIAAWSSAVAGPSSFPSVASDGRRFSSRSLMSYGQVSATPSHFRGSKRTPPARSSGAPSTSRSATSGPCAPAPPPASRPAPPLSNRSASPARKWPRAGKARRRTTTSSASTAAGGGGTRRGIGCIRPRSLIPTQPLILSGTSTHSDYRQFTSGRRVRNECRGMTYMLSVASDVAIYMAAHDSPDMISNASVGVVREDSGARSL